MKKIWIILGSLVALALIALVVIVVKVNRVERVSLPPDLIPASVTLPADRTTAQKELKNARKTYDKLLPKQPYIVINTHANKVYLRTEDSVLLVGQCSAGSGGELIDSASGRKWSFMTPHGVFKISSKIADPWWRKPDWAFIEEGETIPKNDKERLDGNMMGDYAMGFGDGYFIHGTIYERLLGINVTHGCVRMGAEDLDRLYKKVPIGTPVYVF